MKAKTGVCFIIQFVAVMAQLATGNYLLAIWNFIGMLAIGFCFLHLV